MPRFFICVSGHFAWLRLAKAEFYCCLRHLLIRGGKVVVGRFGSYFHAYLPLTIGFIRQNHPVMAVF